MRLTLVEQAVVGVAVAVVLFTLFLVWRSRRALGRRLTAVVTRLERAGAHADTGRGLERLLHRLERAADDNVLRMSEAESAAQRMEVSLARVADEVVMWDDQRKVVLRNREAQEPLVEQALEDLRDAALAGEAKTQGLDLFGPPRRTLVVSAAPLDDGWRTVGAVAIVHDVTERRALEALRRDFTAQAGQELKAPASSVAALAGTLAGEADPALARRLAVRLRDEADRMAAMVDKLVDLNRAEAEESPVREPVPIGLVVGQALERVRPLATAMGVRVDVAEAGPQVGVMGEAGQLAGAVTHLLDNAVKYSNRGGVVHVSAAVDEGFVAVVVRDEGIGIPPRDLDRVFERFYRTDTGRSHAPGTGLGLSIVRHVAGGHGGAVEVESSEGEGSVFTLRLPVAVQAARWSAAS
ncbi:MAG TPA: HAMP domain-containing sensor histidine kinase [Acidimicrobiales bacterium]|jgi:two-component system sensor histidine kinase SenX3|nr:HAMP domain-containing sensor histidine kinase [Acidimicrobiales bacterium]